MSEPKRFSLTRTGIAGDPTALELRSSLTSPEAVLSYALTIALRELDRGGVYTITEYEDDVYRINCYGSTKRLIVETL